MSVKRVVAGLGVVVALSVVANVMLYRSNQSLRGQIVELRSELRAQTVARNRGARKAVKPKARPMARVPQPSMEPSTANRPYGGEPVGHEERIRQTRDRAIDHLFSGMLDAIDETARERGWDDDTHQAVATIVEDSFMESGEIREKVRLGEVDPVQARDHMFAIREDASAALAEILGDEDHRALRETIWGKGPRGRAPRAGIEN